MARKAFAAVTIAVVADEDAPGAFGGAALEPAGLDGIEARGAGSREPLSPLHAVSASTSSPAETARAATPRDVESRGRAMPTICRCDRWLTNANDAWKLSGCRIVTPGAAEGMDARAADVRSRCCRT
ncbi:hypothetical protein JCM9533A_04900 [Catenuloplanes niger JCM 9533]